MERIHMLNLMGGEKHQKSPAWSFLMLILSTVVLPGFVFGPKPVGWIWSGWI